MQVGGASGAEASLLGTVRVGALVMLRVSSLFVFAPVFSSTAIAPRIKAGLVLAITLLLAPMLASAPGAATEITFSAVLSELAAGLVLGFSLTMLSEMVVFASSLLSMEFSFSLVNLVDPVSRVETAVLGQALGWFTTLVLLSAGLHRTLLAALMRSFTAVPVGTFLLTAKTGAAIAMMAGGIFLAGVQLASPVIAAALMVEMTAALIARLAPQMQATHLAVPLKTITCYVVLIGSLAVWPGFLQRHFDALLEQASRLLVVHA